MSIILKGIDMPSKGEDVTIEITSNGYVRAYSTVPMVYDSDIQAIQIPKDHGRLIDGDELVKHLRKDPLFDLVERYGISSVIESRPTILEAED